MKKILHHFFLLLLFTVSAVSFANEANDNPSRDDTQTYHVYDDVYLLSTLKFSYGKPKVTVKSVFPQLQSDTQEEAVGLFNQVVVDVLQQEIDSFSQRIQANSGKSGKNDLFIDYDTSVVQSDKRHLTSIRFTFQGFIAGNKPYHYHKVLNYDLENGEKIELQDLFEPDTNYLEVISAYAEKVLTRRLGDRMSSFAAIAPVEENYRNWNLKPSGFLFTFDDEQLERLGAQTVFIPYSAIKKMICKESVIAPCVYKRKCYRNNLRTGGFIDEA